MSADFEVKVIHILIFFESNVQKLLLLVEMCACVFLIYKYIYVYIYAFK